MPKLRRDRATLFDSIQLAGNRNIYCALSDLGNESSVEQRLVIRMLKDLGYEDSDILSKERLEPVKISLGRKKIKYVPDFQILHRKKVAWIIDAKATTEGLDKWIPQCASYCFEINKDRKEEERAKYFLLTNGLLTKIYLWDSNVPLIELKFLDFQYGNTAYETMRKLLAKSLFGQEQSSPVRKFIFQKPSMQKVRNLFTECHNKIWKMDRRSPASAFSEFIKLMFVKLYTDRELRRDQEIKGLIEAGLPLPSDLVSFSVRWIEARESETDNPVDELLFKRLREAIEDEIRANKKKRVFDTDERIKLKPSTIKEVVRRMEHYDLFGIDEDLNGRLFESFLTATMRGRELGQFFTPRSIVKLMTELAQLRVDRTHLDIVLDGCCGTGGFLIEAMTDMRNKVRHNQSLSSEEKDRLIEQISNEAIFGIDDGVEPPIARIARINMYLHGDGGSRIYFADALDKSMSHETGEDREVRSDRSELYNKLQKIGFDVVLTNPPFAMRYELANSDEARVLEQYDLARRKDGTLRPSLKTSVMFLERYRDLLKPGGKLLTVIDDTVLAGKELPFVRDFIRDNFIIHAVISLHGDAFQRSGARAKTSILYLEKKRSLSEGQPPRTFIAFTTRIGVDDPTSRRTPEAEIDARRTEAEKEIKFLVQSYNEFLNGEVGPWGENGPWAVDSDRLSDRMDVKHCAPMQGRFVTRWKNRGFSIVKLKDLVVPVEGRTIIPCEHPDELFKILAISYDGICRIESEVRGRDLKYPEFIQIKEDDLIFSTINAVQGAVGIVDKRTTGALASANYTVLRCINPIDTDYLWTLLRTAEIRADLLSLCTGFGRHYLYWPEFGEVELPLLPPNERKEIHGKIAASRIAAAQAEDLRNEGIRPILEQLDVESQESRERWNASKPPK